MMDWNIFWSAFGAIGTTVGSLITAIAVVVAVVQYRQPLIKRLKISFTTTFPVYDHGLGGNYHSITIANVGVRQIILTNVYLSTGKKNLVINNLMVDLNPGNPGSVFPKELSPESEVTIYIGYAELANAFQDLLRKEVIRENQKIKVLVTDTTSGRHFCKMGTTAKRIAKLGG